jgi:hypothetical protein
VFVEHSQGTCAIKSGRVYARALGTRAELIEGTVAAGEQWNIAGFLRP